MNPFYFGTRQRRLFGIYTPRRAGAGQRAMVLCHPWGQEYLRAHRSMRQLANLLTASGIHTLRFDYFGTGDSGGDMTEADLAGWQADIGMAIDELLDTTGVTRVGLVGLRLGATLAAGVASKRRKDVDTLVLWDPIVAGPAYVDELKLSAQPLLARTVQAGGGHEICGFPMTVAMTNELAAIDLLASLASPPARTLVIVSAEAACESLKQALRARPAGLAIPVECVPSQPAWLEDRHSGAGVVPVKLLQRIAQWLD